LPLQALKGKALASFCASPKWINIWQGSVSSGKTVTTLFSWVEFVINGPPGELVMIGKTERTLKRNVIDLLILMFGEDKVSTVGMGKGEVHICGRRVYLVGANDERAEQKIRGVSLVGAYCDEITIFPESFFQMLLSRLRSPGARLYGTTNPDSPYHWLKTNFLEKPNIDLASYHFTLDDNPYLDASYVNNLKTTYTGLWYRRFILGEWCQAEGAVYSEWEEAHHVLNDIPNSEFHDVCIDYGTTNPCVFLLCGNDGGNVFVEREYYYDSIKAGKQKTDSEYSSDLKNFVKGVANLRMIIVDPSATSFKAQLRKDFPNVQLKDANNDVLDGIRLTANLLHNGHLHVHTSCANLRKEFASYTWDSNCQIKGEDKPLKQFDHALDALRYKVLTTMGKASQPRVLRRIV